MAIIMNHVKSIKYQDIMKKTIELFIRHGIKRVTVEQICKTSGVSKMTFYKYFRNKTELIQRIITEMKNEAYIHFHNIMTQDIPFHEKAKWRIKYKLEKIREYGDLFLYELREIPELQPFLLEMNREDINEILEFVKRGQEEGTIHEHIKPEFYQFLLEKLSLMMEDEKLKGIFSDTGQRFEELINVLFYGVFKKQGGPIHKKRSN